MTLKNSNRSLGSAGQAAASSRWSVRLARGGLVARSVNYVLIGVLAAQIGLGIGGEQADRAGALHAVAAHRGGSVVLWLLALGFAGLVTFGVYSCCEARWRNVQPG
jgi:Domain of Unknown Function (DUF1206)